jgi:DNA polymerase III delta prime subunit
MRLIIHTANKGYLPSDREDLLAMLRKYIDARNIRISSNHIEIEVWSSDLFKVRDVVSSIVGDVFMISSINELENRLKIDDPEKALELFIQLFNEERYWEAHIVLENIWQKNKDPVIQLLIKIAASHIKIQENKPEYAVKIALECINSLKRGKIGCIDLEKLKSKLKEYIRNLKPVILKCE